MGEVVFDPFCGSGTTLLETESNCRIGIGLELDKEYCKLIEKRLKENVKLFKV
ncbi:MAG: site-specific DNA-methyltransferase [Helicobacter sp.]|nr:site-specific DNA-methyltransferase [Helicobacter sp.]